MALGDPNDPTTTGGSGLGDILAGIGGAPVNRLALGGMMLGGQAIAGLRTAQTEEALLNAQKAREQEDARSRLEGALTSEAGPDGQPIRTPSEAKVLATTMIAGYGNAEQAEMAHKTAIQARNTQTLGNPNADPNARMAADQALNPGANPYQIAGNQLIPRFAPNSQTAPAAVQQTPVSAAHTGLENSNANLSDVRAAVGGFAPRQGQIDLSQYPELARAVNEGRLDPLRLNTRNIQVMSQLAQGNPNLDFNAMHSAGVLQANPQVQQRSWVLHSLPEVMSHMVDLGKAVGYNDIRFVGRAQQWLNGEINDPAMQEYMTVRNDALMTIANVMRGVGMSDQAHHAEIEAASPTMSPQALDAWLRGQMTSLKPRLTQMDNAMHPGRAPAPKPVGPENAPPAPGGGAAATGGPQPAPGGPQPAPDPLAVLQAAAHAEQQRRAAAAAQPPAGQ